MTSVIWAQGFSFIVYSPSSVTSEPVLKVYDKGEKPRVIKSSEHTSASVFTFPNTVRQTTYAEVWYPEYEYGVPIFLEGNDIELHVELNDDGHLTFGSATGSRANSQFRYLLEQCNAAQEDKSQPYAECISAFVLQNPTSVLSPTLVYSYLSFIPGVDYHKLKELTNAIQGAARKSHHYLLLTKRIERMENLQPGQSLPSFKYPDSTGTLLLSTALESDSAYHVLLFSDSQRFPPSMNRQLKALQKTIRRLSGLGTSVKLVTIPIDKHPQQWDSPMVQLLLVDYCPYLIVVNPQGKIMARGLTIWEADNLIDSLPRN